MIDILFEAAEAAENTAPVETSLSFDTRCVYVRQRLFTGDKTLGYERAISWAELYNGRFNLIEYHIKAGREAVLAEWEGSKSTNPNREHAM